VLLVLLVKIAKATAPALEKGTHPIIFGRALSAIPQDLEGSKTAASCNARNRFAATWIAKLLMDLRNRTWIANVIEEAKWAFGLKKPSLPVSLCELCCSHG